MAARLASPVDLNEYFEKDEVAGVAVSVMEIGPCSIPTGSIEASDPLFTLGIDDTPYIDTCQPGEYTTEVCVVAPRMGDDARYAAVRLRFSDRRAETFDLALIGDEDLRSLQDDDFFGFQVGTGLACIADMEVAEAYGRFLDGWYEQHPEGDIYQDYFADLFISNARENPANQTPEGDWLCWTVPGTEYHLPIFHSGFGDGIYPVYWGRDSDGAICQVVIQFIDISLAYEGE